MRNDWLARRPQIYQQSNPFLDYYGRWYISKGTSPDIVYLHPDGIWRSSTFNPRVGDYTGFYHTKIDAEKVLDHYRKI
jgi:hypothetical protein